MQFQNRQSYSWKRSCSNVPQAKIRFIILRQLHCFPGIVLYIPGPDRYRFIPTHLIRDVDIFFDYYKPAYVTLKKTQYLYQMV